MLNPLRVVFLSALLLVATGNPPAAVGEDSVDVSEHPWIGEEAPGFALDTVAGEKVKLEDFEGRYLVVHFGASW